MTRCVRCLSVHGLDGCQVKPRTDDLCDRCLNGLCDFPPTDAEIEQQVRTRFADPERTVAVEHECGALLRIIDAVRALYYASVKSKDALLRQREACVAGSCESAMKQFMEFEAARTEVERLRGDLAHMQHDAGNDSCADYAVRNAELTEPGRHREPREFQQWWDAEAASPYGTNREYAVAKAAWDAAREQSVAPSVGARSRSEEDLSM